MRQIFTPNRLRSNLARSTIVRLRPLPAILATIGAFIAVPRAHAGYTGIVLYQLAPPSGGNGNIYVDNVENEAADGGQVAGAAVFNQNGGTFHALLWSAGPTSPIDLNPAGFSGSIAEATDGYQQVGDANQYAGVDDNQAVLWSGTAASAVDLNPSGFSISVAYEVDGTQQVGQAGTDAMLWSGTPQSAVNLNPAGYSNSAAFATDVSHQVGMAELGTNGYHATLWSGTAQSAVDLNPNGFYFSEALGVSGNQEVGIAGSDAFLWYGSAASAVNLDPSGFVSSQAMDTNGTEQVGYGVDPQTSGYNQALLWSGSAASFIDLASLLPVSWSGGSSYATAIDPNGNVYGYGTSAENPNTTAYALEWTPTPPILGDANLDGVVDSADLAALDAGLENGLTGWSNGDFNQDGVINADDFSLFQLGLAEYQAGTPIYVPEPSSACVVLSTIPFLLQRRRKTKRNLS